MEIEIKISLRLRSARTAQIIRSYEKQFSKKTSILGPRNSFFRLYLCGAPPKLNSQRAPPKLSRRA